MSDARQDNSDVASPLPTPPGRRRMVLIVVLVLILLLISGAILLIWHPWDPRPPMRVDNVRAACPPAATQEPDLGTDRATLLVPERDYSMAQLCTVGRSDPTPLYRLTDDEARTLVQRLNALPTSPPRTGCVGVVTTATELLLTDSANVARRIRVALDTAPCGAVRGPGGTRYGGDQLHRYVTTLRH